MFQFPGFASPLREMIGLAADRVAPFGNPGITACLQLPQAYRSLPRPSSPPCAKASTVRPYALDLTSLSVSVAFLRRIHTTRQLLKHEKMTTAERGKVRTTTPGPFDPDPNGRGVLGVPVR